MRRYWDTLILYLKPQWRRVTLLAALLLADVGMRLAIPQILAAFIDTAVAGSATEALVTMALWFLGVALASQIVSVAATYVSENVGWTATNALRCDLLAHCLRLDMGFHKAHTPGEMIERVDGDVSTLSTFFSQFVIQILGNVGLLAGILLLLAREDWRLSLTLALFSLLALGIMWRCQNIAVPHWAAERQANAEFYGFLEERLVGTEDIRANGAVAYVMRRFYGLMRAQLRTSLKAGMMVNVLLNSSLFLSALGIAAALAVGAYLYVNRLITIGTVYLVFHYATMLERPIETIAHQVGELQKAGAGIQRVQEILATQSAVQEAPVSAAAAALLPGPLAVAFRGVTFGYDDGNGETSPAPDGRNGKETVLHDLSFELEPGTVLGLLGRTGSGKTTLIRLLLRLYDPDQGSVALGADGGWGAWNDVRSLPLAYLRQRVGVVTQNVQLFRATVRDNLTFFAASGSADAPAGPTCVSDAEIERVIETLGLGEWLRSLPQGLDTMLESGGVGLSAGEAQLLAFTRIFMQDPGLVILDEASSRLDPATEVLIERAVDRLLKNRTGIVIAHRLGTVQRADRIMILDDGRICEYGQRAGLASDPGSRFYALLQTGLEEVLA